MALIGFLRADALLRNYSLTHTSSDYYTAAQINVYFCAISCLKFLMATTMLIIKCLIKVLQSLRKHYKSDMATSIGNRHNDLFFEEDVKFLILVHL